MKYINADRLKAEIERLGRNWDGVQELQPVSLFQADLYELLDIIDSLQQEQPSLPDNLELNMTRTKLELNDVETLTHLVRAKAVESGPFQGLYNGILSKLNKMFDEEYAERERKEKGE